MSYNWQLALIGYHKFLQFSLNDKTSFDRVANQYSFSDLKLFNKSVWFALFKIAYLKHFIVFSSAGYQINHRFDRRIQSTGGSGVYEVYSG